MTIEDAFVSMEGNLRKAVTKLNEAQSYRAATQVQNTLHQIANAYGGLDDEAKATELD